MGDRTTSSFARVAVQFFNRTFVLYLRAVLQLDISIKNATLAKRQPVSDQLKISNYEILDFIFVSDFIHKLSK